MTLTDEDIARALAPLQPLRFAVVPYEGTWTSPPYPRRVVDGRSCAALCIDDGVSELVVDLETSAVLTRDLGASTSFLVSSSLAAFVACARAYLEAQPRAADADEHVLEAIASELARTFRAIDPAATFDEDRSFWLVVAEELGYGF